MGKKADRQAARIAAARWREFCDSWVAIGQAADREWRMLTGRQTREKRARARSRLHLAQVMVIAAGLSVR